MDDGNSSGYILWHPIAGTIMNILIRIEKKSGETTTEDFATFPEAIDWLNARWDSDIDEKSEVKAAEIVNEKVDALLNNQGR